MRLLGGSGQPTMRRPRGLMTPRGPAVYLVLLVLTLAAIWFWSRQATPEKDPSAAPAVLMRPPAR
jgi:hypothetical protein